MTIRRAGFECVSPIVSLRPKSAGLLPRVIVSLQNTVVRIISIISGKLKFQSGLDGRHKL